MLSKCGVKGDCDCYSEGRSFKKTEIFLYLVLFQKEEIRNNRKVREIW